MILIVSSESSPFSDMKHWSASLLVRFTLPCLWCERETEPSSSKSEKIYVLLKHHFYNFHHFLYKEIDPVVYITDQY